MADGWPRPPGTDHGRNPTGGWGSIILCEIFGIGCSESGSDSEDESPDDYPVDDSPMGDFPIPDPDGPMYA